MTRRLVPLFHQISETDQAVRELERSVSENEPPHDRQTLGTIATLHRRLSTYLQHPHVPSEQLLIAWFFAESQSLELQTLPSPPPCLRSALRPIVVALERRKELLVEIKRAVVQNRNQRSSLVHEQSLRRS